MKNYGEECQDALDAMASWDGTGLPPPPPFPPMEIVVRGVDLFGIVQRAADRENAANQATYERSTREHRRLFDIMRRLTGGDAA